jgi:hypothetical protein
VFKLWKDITEKKESLLEGVSQVNEQELEAIQERAKVFNLNKEAAEKLGLSMFVANKTREEKISFLEKSSFLEVQGTTRPKARSGAAAAQPPKKVLKAPQKQNPNKQPQLTSLPDPDVHTDVEMVFAEHGIRPQWDDEKRKSTVLYNEVSAGAFYFRPTFQYKIKTGVSDEQACRWHVWRNLITLIITNEVFTPRKAWVMRNVEDIKNDAKILLENEVLTKKQMDQIKALDEDDYGIHREKFEDWVKFAGKMYRAEWVMSQNKYFNDSTPGRLPPAELTGVAKFYPYAELYPSSKVAKLLDPSLKQKLLNWYYADQV